MESPFKARYRGLEIDYGLFTDLDKQAGVLLWIAESEGLLEYLGSRPDGYCLIAKDGVPLYLRLDEVQGYVLAAFHQAGLDLAPITYRTGLSTGGPNRASAVDGEEHD